MGSKFISTSDGDLRAVSDGTLDILGASLGGQNLTPGFPIKIDSERKLYSTALAIADVVNLQSELDATIQTPYSGTIEATDFKSDTTSLSSIETKTQNMNTSGVVTNFTGKLHQNDILLLQMTTGFDITTTGSIACSDLTTDAYSLNATLTDHSGGIATNKNDISTLEAKTVNISAPTGFTAVVGLLNIFEGGDDPTVPNLRPNGPILCGTIAVNDAATIRGLLVVQDGPFSPGSLTTPLLKADGTDPVLIGSDLDFQNTHTLKNCQSINGLSSIGGKYSQTGPDITVQSTTNPTSILNLGAGSLIFSDFKAGDN